MNGAASAPPTKERRESFMMSSTGARCPAIGARNSAPMLRHWAANDNGLLELGVPSVRPHDIRNLRALAMIALVALGVPAAAAAEPMGETIDQALCRMIEGAAAAHRLPVDFFTRLIWQESSFRP